ncbi:MAG: chemotaxis protein CheB [Spirochaetota bacterium]
MADPGVVVGIGASAGGLEAIERFFDHVQGDGETSYVIVQHLSPDHKSLMSELLAPHTEMPIREVEDGERIAAGTVYLMPRKSNLTVFNGRLFLTTPHPGLNLPIDIFLRSLAEEYGERAVAVILSGTGSDGTRGIRAVKEAGGAVFVQDESTARFDGMPLSAIGTGIVDHVLPPEEIPGRIATLCANPATLMGPDEQPTSQSTVAHILLLVKRKTGVDLTRYKPSTIYRRIERRIGITQSESIGQYLELLRDDPAEVATLFKEILIGVTKFFRDADAYEVLQQKVIPEIVRQTPKDRPLRVWVPGCSTGEEAYSIAILLAEYLEREQISHPVRVFATDIDRDALQFASAGLYSESIAADASRERLQKYFVRKGESYQIAPEIRESVIFAYHNVFNDPPFRSLDLVSCRNLLIYLEPVLQQRVLANFAFALDVGAFLVLGSSETVGEHARYFEAFDTRWKIFRSVEHRSRGESRGHGFSHGPGYIDRGTVPVGRWDRDVEHDDPLNEAIIEAAATPVRAATEQHNLSSFHEHPPASDDSAARIDPDREAQQRIRDLEIELHHSQENLQATIQELHSVNEELITVNSEYQRKIEELSLLNADVTNLLAASPAGIIFLDAETRVRKYTSAATEQFSIIRSDIGRPVVDLSHRLRYPEFADDVRAVASASESRERTVDSDDGRRYLIRMLPYEDAERRRKGTVIGLVDITQHGHL